MLTTLTQNDLLRRAPSIFSEQSAINTTEKYQHISTIKIIEGLAGIGFLPTYAGQSACRLADKRNFAKHVIRFRHVDTLANQDGLIPELVLINSHDGLSSYRLMSGVYRVVCSNGLIAGNTYSDVRVRHQGDVMKDVIEGSYEVINVSREILKSASNMSKIQLTTQQKLAFAESAHGLRFEDGESLTDAIKPEKLLSIRRQADQGDDLFTVFNVVQENIIKGGIRGYTRTEQGFMGRRVRTREVKSIDQNTALNRALWTLAEKMAELKQ